MITKTKDATAAKKTDYPAAKESTRRLLAQEERQVMEMIRARALKNYDAKQTGKKPK